MDGYVLQDGVCTQSCSPGSYQDADKCLGQCTHKKSESDCTAEAATASPLSQRKKERKDERKEGKKSRAAGAITSMFARTVDVNVTRLLAEIYGIVSLCGSLNQRALWEVESSKAA